MNVEWYIQVNSPTVFIQNHLIISLLDVKPGNTLISIAPTDEQITEYIKQNPSATYEPRIEPDLSPDPIITVKSQPLPNFGLDPSLSNLEIRLADYGAGESFAPLQP